MSSMENEMRRGANEIIKELLKPQNIDLLIAVRELGDGSDIESFMYGFTQSKPMSFDKYSAYIHELHASGLFEQLGVDVPEVVNMSAEYDKYLARLDDHNDKVNLDQTATARFKAIVDKVDDGWTGAMYGVIMRGVQAELSAIASN